MLPGMLPGGGFLLSGNPTRKVNKHAYSDVKEQSW
jgi:hypothetical protein